MKHWTFKRKFCDTVFTPEKGAKVGTESPSAPGIPIVYRLPEERQANPDRLNLDRYL